LVGRVAIVTGGGTGIGAETARVLALAGARVIIGVRTEAKGAAAAKAINESLAKIKKEGSVRVLPLDLADFDSIRTFVQKFLEIEKELHLLVNNAGVMATPYAKTKQGFESQFGTNHLGHFLLTQLLLPTLKQSVSAGKPARVVCVSSMLHTRGNIDWLNFCNDEKNL